MSETVVHLPGERCPVCGKQAVCIVDRAAGLPVTLCLNCDTQQMIAEMGYSRRQVWWLHVRVWGDRQVKSGMMGVALMLLITLCLAASFLPDRFEFMREVAALVGMVAAFASFQLYVFPLAFREQR